VYNEHTNPSEVPGICDIDGSPLVQREDDKAETIRARLALQLASLEDVVDHYAAAGTLRTVDGVHAIEVVTQALIDAIGDGARDGQEVI
jgi:adenylate kinase